MAFADAMFRERDATPTNPSLRATSTLNGVKVYEVALSKFNPAWAEKQPTRKQRKDESFQRRVELIQDLEFPTSSTRGKLSDDGQFLVISGLHPPQFKCFDLANVSCKFTRHLDSEVVEFQMLGEDYGKIAFLCADRAIRFHAKFGTYYDVRTPRQGRDMTMSKRTADLIVCGSSKDVHRLNLEKGRFLAPLEAKCEELNCCGISPSHGLLAIGGNDGSVECFDLRQKRSAGRVHAVGNDDDMDPDEKIGVTSLRFDNSGLHLACGSSDGIVRLFDLRSSRVRASKDHMYGFPIVDIKFHEAADGTKRIISTDEKIIKVWDQNSGDNYVAIEPRGEDNGINDIVNWENSGLIFTISEDPKIGCYFVPALGPAPKWCSFLENLTEEMEEQKRETLYDDYRFVTREELNTLGLEHLIGTKMLRAYMHGYFMDNRLYGKAKSVSNPFSYEDYKNKKIAVAMEKERQTRIAPKKKLKMPKVNAAYAAKLASGEKRAIFKTGDVDADADNENAGENNDLMQDERFGALFKNKDFEIDEKSEHYKMLHPNAAKIDARKKREMIEEHFDTFDTSSDEDEEERIEVANKTKKEKVNGNSNKVKSASFIPSDKFLGRKEGLVFTNGEKGLGYYHDIHKDDRKSEPTGDSKKTKKKSSGKSIGEPKMFSVKDAFHKSAFEKNLNSNIDLPLFERAKLEGGAAKTLEDAEKWKLKKNNGDREANFDVVGRRKSSKKRPTGFGIREDEDDNAPGSGEPPSMHQRQNRKRRGAENLMQKKSNRGGRHSGSSR